MSSWCERAALTQSCSEISSERGSEEPEMMISCDVVLSPLIMAVAIFPTPINPIFIVRQRGSATEMLNDLSPLAPF